jgi:hypothetical protein
VFGQLKIVPSADIGQLGPQQGEAASYDWKWHYSAGRWIIWIALIFALVVPKANRNIRVLLILIPLVIVNILWLLFMKFTAMNSTDALQFSIIFNSMAVGVTVLWLIANSFARFGSAVQFLLSFGTVVIVAGLGTLSYSTEFSTEMVLFLALLTFMAFTILVAITISRRLCGGTYRPICFLIWLALWMLLGSFVATLGFLIIGSIIFSSGPDSFGAIVIFIFAGSTFGLFLYVLNLPFMILGFAHPFFRERFCACLRLKEALAYPQRADIGLINEQNSGKEIPEKGDFV